MSKLSILNIDNNKEIREFFVNIDFSSLNRRGRYYFLEKNLDGSISFFSVQIVGSGITYKDGARVIEECIFFKDDIKINLISHCNIFSRAFPINCGIYDIVDELRTMYGRYIPCEFNKYLEINQRNIHMCIYNMYMNKNLKKVRDYNLCDYSKIPCESINNIGRLNRPLNAAYVQRISKNSACIRIFLGYDGNVIEHSRVYISEKKTIFCHLSFNGFVVDKKLFTDSFDFAIAGKDDLNGTRAGYCFNYDSVKYCLSLYAKGFENLIKMELDNIYNFFIDNDNYASIDDKLNAFGLVDLNANSFSKMCGVPQYLLEVVDEFFDPESNYKADSIKWLISLISDGVDKDTFEKALYDENSIRIIHGSYMLDTIYLIANEFDNSKIEDILSYVVNIKRTFSVIYADYIDMLLRYHLKNYGFSWKSYNIVDDHNRALEFSNIIDEEDDEKLYSANFSKQKDIWENYSFRDDKFSVISPKEIKDFFVESQTLKHCVRTYLKDVSEGKTIIMFIRKNDDINKPFYTLEIRDNAIRQCHGFGNCDVTFEISKFLNKYCKAKNIKKLTSNMALAAN